MSSETALALAALGANVITFSAVIVGWKQHQATLEKQRELADLGHVRIVLDDAAVTLHKLAYALDSVRSNLWQYGFGFFQNAERAKPYWDLDSIGRDADALLERLEIRFREDSEVVRAFSAVNESVLAIYQKLGVLKLEPDPDPGPAQQQVAKFVDEVRATVDEQRPVFDAKRKEFMAAAHRAAGAKLPS